MPSLHLYDKLKIGDMLQKDITYCAWPTWRRSIRARGGFWMGDFTISPNQMSVEEMWQFFQTQLGSLIKEKTFGMITWEGEIVEMTLTVGGVSHTITLDIERWHNRVKVQYQYPRLQDSQQGVLAYDPGWPAVTATFHDTLQDFSDWETAAPGPAVYQCIVTNNDDTTVHFFCGPATAITNPNDAIRSYLDVAMTTMGWNGETAAKTPVSYQISHVERAGVTEQTDWAEDATSIAQYGESQYIDVRGELMPAVAEALRARRLLEHAYPKSFGAGGMASGTRQRARQQDRLTVSCAGYAFSMNRRYMEIDTEIANLSDHIATLVDGTADAAEFVSPGTIAENVLQHAILREQNSQRLWDLCEELQDLGDGASHWLAAVYAGRLLDYKAVETEQAFYWRNNQLVNQLMIPVHPTLIRPDIVVETAAPFGTGTAGNKTSYIEEVEFIAPSAYRLLPSEGEAFLGAY